MQGSTLGIIEGDTTCLDYGSLGRAERFMGGNS